MLPHVLLHFCLQMQAPGQDAAAYVINEESEVVATTFGPSDPIFSIPEGVKCFGLEETDGSIMSLANAKQKIAALGGHPGVLDALPEVRLARALLHRNKKIA
jgi:hypothetical protein